MESTVPSLFNVDTLQIFDLPVESVKLFALLTVPGVVMMKTWELRTSTSPPDYAKQMVEVATCGLLNLAIGYPLLGWLMSPHAGNHPGLQWLAAMAYALLLPAVISLGVAWLRGTALARRFLKGSSPTAWDGLFVRRQQCFVLIHLKTGKLVGGYFGPNSEVSSHPAPQELYLEKAIKVDENGVFLEYPDHTYGILLARNEIEYMEFFDVPVSAPAGVTRLPLTFQVKAFLERTFRCRLQIVSIAPTQKPSRPKGEFPSHGNE